MKQGRSSIRLGEPAKRTGQRKVRRTIGKMNCGNQNFGVSGLRRVRIMPHVRWTIPGSAIPTQRSATSDETCSVVLLVCDWCFDAGASPSCAASSPASANAASHAEVSKEVSDKLVQLDQRVTAAQAAGDSAWMLTSAALVLMMTGPGLALFYGGLVRRKNTLAIMMQSFMLMAVITVMWALVGYSLCFGGNGPVIGGFEHAFLRGVGAEPNADYAGTIPQMTFMVYQLMFAIITPALITGATAERMKFSGTVLFLTLWFLVVYAPLAHMVWGKGGLLNASLGGKFPTLDFAGGT